MHRLPTSSSVHRFRLVAFLYCLRYLLIVGCIGTILYALVMDERELIILGIALGVVTIFSCLLQLMFAGRTRCPLCMTPVLARVGCSKNRKARPLLGSYHLRVALSTISKGYFTCQYCNESTSIEVRTRRSGYSRD